MDLESNFVCEGKRIKTDISDGGFGSPDVRIKKKRLFGIRDFPVAVRLPQRRPNELTKDTIRLEVPESIHDSSLENPSKQQVESSNKAAEHSELVVQAAAKMYPPPRNIPVKRYFPQGCVAINTEINARASADFGNNKKVESNEKAVELPENVQKTENMHPPQRRTSAIRQFPQSCVAKNPVINPGVSLQSAEFRNLQKGDLTNRKAELPEKVVETTVENFPPRRTISVCRSFPRGFASKFPPSNAGKTAISPDLRCEQRDEASELPDAVALTAKNMKSPQRRLSVSRCFPQGYSEKDPDINPRLLPISTGLRTEHKVKESDTAAELPKSVAQTMMKTDLPNQEILGTRCPDDYVERNPEISARVSPVSFDVKTGQMVKVQFTDEAAELPSSVCTNFKTVQKVKLSDKNAELPERVAQTAEETYSSQCCVSENSQTNAGVTLTLSDFRTTQQVKLSDKVKEQWKRVFPQQQEMEICEIQRGASCSRYPPQYCVANNPQNNTEGAPTSADFRTELQERYVRNTLVQNDAEPIIDNQHQRNMESTSKITKTQSNYECLEAKREKWSKNDTEKGSHRMASSKKMQTHQPQEEPSIDSEKPSHRVIVMALKAPTYYQSMQKKTVKKR